MEHLAALVERADIRSDGKPGKQTAIALVWWSWSALLSQDYATAHRTAERAVALDPESMNARVNLAHALLMAGRAEEAKTAYLGLGQHAERLKYEGNLAKSLTEDFEKMMKSGIDAAALHDVRSALGLAQQ